MHEVDGERVEVVFDLLREGVGQASKAADGPKWSRPSVLQPLYRTAYGRLKAVNLDSEINAGIEVKTKSGELSSA